MNLVLVFSGKWEVISIKLQKSGVFFSTENLYSLYFLILLYNVIGRWCSAVYQYINESLFM